MNPESHITNHFKQKEFVRSETFPEIAAKIVLTERDIANIYRLLSITIAPERVYSKEETHILQGKRSDELFDELVKGGFNPSPTSKHFFRKQFDCAIDFQKKVYLPNTNPRQINITSSRIRTVCAYFWILNNCAHSFGTMYYQEPDSPEKIGFIHISSITPRKPTSNHYIQRIK